MLTETFRPQKAVYFTIQIAHKSQIQIECNKTLHLSYGRNRRLPVYFAILHTPWFIFIIFLPHSFLQLNVKSSFRSQLNCLDNAIFYFRLRIFIQVQKKTWNTGTSTIMSVHSKKLVRPSHFHLFPNVFFFIPRSISPWFVFFSHKHTGSYIM